MVMINELNIQMVRGKPSRILSWWCFNPGIAIEKFSKLGVGSIILTSGTLSPIDFRIRLENPHVILDSQIWAGVVHVGPSGYSFNSSYRSRDSPEHKLELGNAIVNFARIVPDGLLIFFPSYYLLDKLIDYWKNTDYMAKLKETSCPGSVFFAVYRGKVIEGLDFADHAGRAVVVLGMPFVTLTDPKVRLKREILDEKALAVPLRTGCKLLTGEEWYSQQASHAVNQVIVSFVIAMITEQSFFVMKGVRAGFNFLIFTRRELLVGGGKFKSERPTTEKAIKYAIDKAMERVKKRKGSVG